MNRQIAQIPQISHTVATAGDPAGLGLALAVAAELHPAVTRAPELATTGATIRRATAARPRRRTVRG
ncbi:hypothetical protein [Streptomyces griseiscabiei]|uniref:4-hydroxythreonine-4-phosphate dehydrogenase n=1 Tax=Streptomyces griseiscabiei TaxID=2993540 RepID=A0ABU4LHX5_9ACTN|nr:hypothetical protein [Streptomyces griseiscabiei]MBZ3907843.1 hypothetical protein [Streptomyces griseiscabiei]MDX2915213.1 hypothetical protein [Streptomyces griseiscabiei]